MARGGFFRKPPRVQKIRLLFERVRVVYKEAKRLPFEESPVGAAFTLYELIVRSFFDDASAVEDKNPVEHAHG